MVDVSDNGDIANVGALHNWNTSINFLRLVIYPFRVRFMLRARNDESTGKVLVPRRVDRDALL